MAMLDRARIDGLRYFPYNFEAIATAIEAALFTKKIVP